MSGGFLLKTISQKKLTRTFMNENENNCPAEGLIKMLSGKWKPQIFKLAKEGPVRFNTLLRQLEGSNKQSLSIALKELEENGVLKKEIIADKPLHIEYTLTFKGKMLIPVFQQLETML